MAKFVWVGRNMRNQGGSSSKAYTIRRSGKKVTTTYGPVEVIGARGGKYFWRSDDPSGHVYTFQSDTEAREWVKEQSVRKEQKGYDRLPGRVRIGPKRRP